MRQNKSGKNKKRSNRSLVILIIILIAVVGALVYFMFFYNADEKRFIEPNSNAGSLVSSQLFNNMYIGSVRSDVSLFLGDVPPALAGKKELTDLENNYLGKGPDGDLLVDEAVVAALIRFNSNWVAYCLGKGDLVFGDVKAGSPAEKKIDEKKRGSQVAYHELYVGRIMTDGKDYYITAREVYTLAKDGKLDEHNDTVVYKFVKEGVKLLVFDFEVYEGSGRFTLSQ